MREEGARRLAPDGVNGKTEDAAPTGCVSEGGARKPKTEVEDRCGERRESNASVLCSRWLIYAEGRSLSHST